jgi:hypothetical protein
MERRERFWRQKVSKVAIGGNDTLESKRHFKDVECSGFHNIDLDTINKKSSYAAPRPSY